MPIDMSLLKGLSGYKIHETNGNLVKEVVVLVLKVAILVTA